MKTSAIIAPGTFPCATAPLQGPYEQVLRQAADIGYDGVQLTVNRPEEVDVPALLALTAQYGLEVSAIATGMGYTVDGLSLGMGDEEKRRGAVERMKGHIDLAKKLGGAMVIIGAIRGRYADADSPQHYHSQFDRSIREVVDWAEQAGVVVIFEANDHLETDAYISTRETAEYIRRINSPCFRLQLDTMHMLYEGEEIYRPILDNADILAQMDISGEDRRCPAEGDYDYPQVIRALKEGDFRGWLAFEFRPAPPKDAARVAYDYITNLIKTQ